MFGGKPSKRQNYVIELKLGKEDYTGNLQRVRIIASTATFYHMFVLEIKAEGEKIISKSLFGKEEIELSITPSGQAMDFGEALKVKLTYVESTGLQLKNRPSSSIDEDASATRPEKIVIGCIATDALKNMSTQVNKCFQEDFQKEPIEVLKKIIEEFLPNMEKEVDDQEKNETKVPRTYNIPRMPFSNFIRYMDKDDFGGIYKGPYVAFHDWEKFYCFSTKSRLKQGPDYTVTLLATDGKGSGGFSSLSNLFSESSSSNDTFYTTVPIETIYKGPQQLMEVGSKRTVRVNPTDDLFAEHSIDSSQDVMKNNTSKSQGGDEFLGDMFGAQNTSGSKNIETYRYTGGHDGNKQALETNMGTDLSAQSEIIMSFSGNSLNPKKLLVVGSPVKFVAQSQDYQEYTGLYVAQAIDLTYSRKNSEEYNALCRVRAIRANLKEEGQGSSGGMF